MGIILLLKFEFQLLHKAKLRFDQVCRLDLKGFILV